MIVTDMNNWNAFPYGEAWKKAFEFLRSVRNNAADGTIPLMGDDMFARVMSYETKDPANAKVEAHDRYVDIQMTITGAEGLDWFPREDLHPITAYDPIKDVTYFEPESRILAHVDVLPGYCVVLFPEDAHRPALRVGRDSARIQKVVIKCDRRLLSLKTGTS